VEAASEAADSNPDSLAAAIDHHPLRMTADPAAVRWLNLGSILTVAGLITEAELETALEAQKHRDTRLGAVLVELGLLTTRQIAGAIAEQCQVEFVDLDTAAIEPEAVKLLPEQLARRFEALPLRILPDGLLLLAMADPTNLRAHDDVQLALGAQTFRVAVADEAQLIKALGRAYRSRIELSVVAADAAEELRRAEDIRDMASSTPTIQLVNSVLTNAIEDGASDLHFEPKRDRLQIRARIDGVMRDVAEVPKHMQPAVISRLKVMGSLDIAERRAPQDGRVSVHFGGDPIDLRIAVVPLRHGEQVVLRIHSRRAQRPRIETLGLSSESADLLLQALEQPFGAIVVCGPTGSGKTTTLYAALDRLAQSPRAVMTIEDPIEYDLSTANQIEVDEKAGLTFATGLRTILRSDPDVLLVGEIRDAETAQIAIQAGLTGHLVLTSLHAHSAAGSVTRLRELGVAPGLISSALNLIVAQRLARRLCVECRRPYEASNEDPELQPGTTLWEAVGCTACAESGYRGRVALYEFLPVRGEIRALVEDSTETIFAAALRDGMRTLRSDGLRLCREGVSTLEEIRRVTGDRLT
jgi:type II secretory ATPase GspE/PulE/Tfp pilus assembly ATPase PilB-like protein